MAIVGYPGWIGSSAVTETGQRWMSAARTAVRQSAAGWMSQLGKVRISRSFLPKLTR